MNLRCQQTTCTMGDCKVPACSGSASTRVLGTVYEPAGKTPLYNAIVYVPNRPLAEFTEGATCETCNTPSGEPVTNVARTDAAGNFILDNVPVGDSIPLVVQIGKWRRESTIPVVACTDNMLTDRNLTRLPANQSEGHIPKIALTTGGADALECLLRKIGLHDSEFTPESGTGRVNLFGGGKSGGMSILTGNNPSAGTDRYDATLNGGAMFTDAEGWWSNVDNLMKYDIVLHSCEGISHPQNAHSNKPAAATAAMQAYANAGGRVFASHWHNYWIERGPAPWPMTAVFNHQGDPGANFVATIDTTFAEGIALSQWLQNVGASTTAGQLVIQGAKRTVARVNPPTLRWAYNGNSTVQYFSFLTPYEDQMNACGKVVFSDLHVSSGSGAATDDDSDVSLPFPTGCRTTELSPQEKALMFILFDLSSCVMGPIG